MVGGKGTLDIKLPGFGLALGTLEPNGKGSSIEPFGFKV